MDITIITHFVVRLEDINNVSFSNFSKVGFYQQPQNKGFNQIALTSSYRDMLAFLSVITKCGYFKSIPGNGVRNACWHFLTQSLELVFPSNDTKNAVTIFLYTCRNIPQAYGYIVVAFHPEVFRYRSFIFS